MFIFLKLERIMKKYYKSLCYKSKIAKLEVMKNSKIQVLSQSFVYNAI